METIRRKQREKRDAHFAEHPRLMHNLRVVCDANVGNTRMWQLRSIMSSSKKRSEETVTYGSQRTEFDSHSCNCELIRDGCIGLEYVT